MYGTGFLHHVHGSLDADFVVGKRPKPFRVNPSPKLFATQSSLELNCPPGLRASPRASSDTPRGRRLGTGASSFDLIARYKCSPTNHPLPIPTAQVAPTLHISCVERYEMQTCAAPRAAITHQPRNQGVW